MKFDTIRHMMALDAATDSGLPAALLVLLPLLGTVVGGGITAFASWLTAKKNQQSAKLLEADRYANTMNLERTRYEREDQRRWDNHVRELCAELLAKAWELEARVVHRPAKSVRQQMEALKLLVPEPGVPTVWTEADRKLWADSKESVAEAMAYNNEGMDLVSEMGTIMAQIEIVAPRSMLQAANAFMAASVDLTGDDYDDEKDRIYNRARAAFVAAIREKLGSSASSLGQQAN
jgi:hypothetical protein